MKTTEVSSLLVYIFCITVKFISCFARAFIVNMTHLIVGQTILGPFVVDYAEEIPVTHSHSKMRIRSPPVTHLAQVGRTDKGGHGRGKGDETKP